MKVKLMALACGLIAPLAFAQTTTVTRETTTVQEIARLDSTHVMTVKGFAPGESISIQTSPDTNPVTIRHSAMLGKFHANAVANVPIR